MKAAGPASFMRFKMTLLVAGLVLADMASSAVSQDKTGVSADFPIPDSPPKPVVRAPAVYPYSQSQAGLTGEVTIEFVIDTEGRVRNAQVIRSNNSAFERPALDAVNQWRFLPGRKAGLPVNVRASQTIVFELGEPGSNPVLWQVKKGKDHASLPPELQWDTAPVPTNTAFPVYPFAALRAGTKGSTRLSFVIGPKGKVIKASVIQATTPEMGLAVLAMIDTWEFTPARKADGTLAFAAVTIEHTFDPDGRRSDAPVSETARSILGLIAKHPEKIIAAGQLDQLPKPISRRAPVYPLALQAAAQPGEAVIEFYIDENGDAQLPRIVSSNAPEFGYAAVQAVASWRFEPPKKKGEAVVTRVQVPVEFRLPLRPAPAP